MDNKELTRLFLSVGSRYNYDVVTATFAPFRDFKVKWNRSYKWISFDVSDYLDDAPETVILSLAETVFGKIDGEDAEYSKNVCSWLTSKEFISNKQAIYVRRFISFKGPSAGRQKDINASYWRLIDSGLIEHDPQICLGWIGTPPGRSIGRSSVLMKVVGMSSLLDSDRISDELLDFCLYSHLARVSLGFNPDNRSKGEEYDRLLSKYPCRGEIETALRKLCLYM